MPILSQNTFCLPANLVHYTGLPDEALVDLHAAAKLDPENKPVRVEIANAKKIISDSKKKRKSSIW